MSVLAVAAISARLLAEAAAGDGYRVVALDAFGDLDTRRAADEWWPIQVKGAAPAIDAGRVLDTLRALSRRGSERPLGWIPGSGFEGRPDLIAAGAALLPLLGTPAEAVRRVRDPAIFFGALAAHAIAHPPVQAAAPADSDGWLWKDANGCGGWHIREAGGAAVGTAVERDVPGSVTTDGGAVSVAPGRYFQRRAPGVAMSATFIANGREALVVGFNQLLVRRIGAHPCVYAGCIGPVDMPAEAARQVRHAVGVLAAGFELRGWGSLDFMRDGAAISVLEVNPRPPASLGLYTPRGQIDAHRRACAGGALPPSGAFTPGAVVGSRIVYAPRPLRLDEAGARRLADQADVHDRPSAGFRSAAGDPICTVSARGRDATGVEASLAARRRAVLNALNH